MTCLDDNTVVEFIQGLLPAEEIAHIEEHVDNCPSCRQLLAEVAKLSFAASSKRKLSAQDLPSSARLNTLGMAGTLATNPIILDPASSELLLGQIIAGRYRVLRPLGSGSFGSVYEVEDLQLQERVALKLLRPEIRDAPSLLKHLHHEIVVGRRISHPNVCRMYDLGTWGEIHFISMALIPGESLDLRLAKGPLAADEGLDILLQICKALEAAHEQGVVHRDLKPSNIMVDNDGRVTVMDFGLARDLRAGPSQSGVLVGSPAYWSPEQAQGQRASECSDIYSLGLMACDIFGAARPTFGGKVQIDKIPLPYRRFILRCLRVRPEERFCSGGEAQAALVAAQHQLQPRTKKLIIFGLSLMVTTLLGSVLLYFLTRPTEPAIEPVSLEGPNPLVGRVAMDRPRPSPPNAPRAENRGSRKPQLARAGTPEIFVAGTEEAPPARDMIAARKVKSHERRSHGPRKRHAPKRVIRAKARPSEKAATAKAAAKDPSNQENALSASARQLGSLEVERRRRKLLLEDIPAYREQRSTAQHALAKKKAAEAEQAVTRMANILRATKIDGTFISKKLQRLNRLKGSLKLDQVVAKKVTNIFAKVHDRYFSGDYEGANAQLNHIWRALGKRE